MGTPSSSTAAGRSWSRCRRTAPTLAYVESRDGSGSLLFVRTLDQLVPSRLGSWSRRRRRALSSVRLARWRAGSATRRPASSARSRPPEAGRQDLRRSRSRGATWLRRRRHRARLRPPKGGLCAGAGGGGDAKPLTELDAARGEKDASLAAGLPDGDAVLFTAQAAESDFELRTSRWCRSRAVRARWCYQGGSYGRYVPSGHLVFVSARNAVRRAIRPRPVRGAGDLRCRCCSAGRDEFGRGRRSVRLLRDRAADLRSPTRAEPISYPIPRSVGTASLVARWSRSRVSP